MKIQSKVNTLTNVNTLTTERAMTASPVSNLARCELLLTNNCNFKCVYCKGLPKEYSRTMSLEEAKEIVELCAQYKLQNLRISGGEPTVWKGLLDLIKYAKELGINHISLSTNGFAKKEYYEALVEAGVNDFSISLDTNDAIQGDKLIGGIVGGWQKTVDNIRNLHSKAHVSIGCVITDATRNNVNEIINFISSLGVTDIRLIPVSDDDSKLSDDIDITSVGNKHAMLQYRVKNLRKGKKARGVTESDYNRCALSLDDLCVVGGYHFPCSVYLREGGKPIGKMNKNFRQERVAWMATHDTQKDAICQRHCLDICVDYNNRYNQYNKIKERTE